MLVNFWATWCDPCKREIPRLERAWKQYRGKDVVFVGIDAQDFDSSARRAIERFGITYPIVYDGSREGARPLRRAAAAEDVRDRPPRAHPELPAR